MRATLPCLFQGILDRVDIWYFWTLQECADTVSSWPDCGSEFSYGFKSGSGKCECTPPGDKCLEQSASSGHADCISSHCNKDSGDAAAAWTNTYTLKWSPSPPIPAFRSLVCLFAFLKPGVRIHTAVRVRHRRKSCSCFKSTILTSKSQRNTIMLASTCHAYGTVSWSLLHPTTAILTYTEPICSNPGATYYRTLSRMHRERSKMCCTV